MRIVFMGTPEFAVPSLQALIDHDYQVVGVFTQPDRPAGRGNRVIEPPIKQLAGRYAIPVYQFERVRRPEGIEAMQALSPDLIITAAFGQILPQKLLDIPPMGTINVHASLLPKHRGAAPINWSIIEGDIWCGVTTMQTDAGLDTGHMLLRKKRKIRPDETAGELTDRMAQLGAELLIETLKALDQGDIKPIRQRKYRASYQPMLNKQVGKIDFTQSPAQVVNLVRGVNPWPGAFAMLPEGTLKVWQAKVSDCDLPGKPGEVLVSSAKQGLIVRCGDGAIELIEIQAPNAKRMHAKAYLMGKTIEVGTVLNG
ncbi:methionyl-tRNA formyltransferase [Eubacteriales bacterium OttesenSCG-928-N13]|nr:methionyl-tRNA formyltransferase [Eubacteriales bacterium OttesenSCG-928-N13]